MKDLLVLLDLSGASDLSWLKNVHSSHGQYFRPSWSFPVLLWPEIWCHGSQWSSHFNTTAKMCCYPQGGDRVKQILLVKQHRSYVKNFQWERDTKNIFCLWGSVASIFAAHIEVLVLTRQLWHLKCGHFIKHFFFKDGFWELRWRPLEGSPMFHKSLKHYFLQKADCMAVFLPHLSIIAYSCIVFLFNFKSRADRAQSWEIEWMDAQNKLLPGSGSSERHRSNLDLDILPSAEGHSNVSWGV